ncbi:hypothetical protein H4R33_006373 [Dimargaris cristalligena]|nr:hypothetical protein H4R33_006373 [Dimargaris cristalligena]
MSENSSSSITTPKKNPTNISAKPVLPSDSPLPGADSKQTKQATRPPARSRLQARNAWRGSTTEVVPTTYFRFPNEYNKHEVGPWDPARIEAHHVARRLCHHVPGMELMRYSDLQRTAAMVLQYYKAKCYDIPLHQSQQRIYREIDWIERLTKLSAARIRPFAERRRRTEYLERKRERIYDDIVRLRSGQTPRRRGDISQLQALSQVRPPLMVHELEVSLDDQDRARLAEPLTDAECEKYRPPVQRFHYTYANPEFVLIFLEALASQGYTLPGFGTSKRNVKPPSWQERRMAKRAEKAEKTSGQLDLFEWVGQAQTA